MAEWITPDVFSLPMLREKSSVPDIRAPDYPKTVLIAMVTKKLKKAKATGKVKKTFKSTAHRYRWWPGFMIAAVAFLLYANTLQHGYVLDDHSAIKGNWVVQKGVAGISTILTTPYRYGYKNNSNKLYRPLPLLMFALEWQIFPDQPHIGHLVNVVLYALTGFFLFLVLARLLPAVNLLFPLLVSLLFIAHPVHVEVVANIKSRDEIMAFLGCLSAIWLLWNYLQTKRIKWLLLALGAYTLAMFSKESVITFLAVFPLLIYFFSKVPWQRNARISLFFTIPVGLYLLARMAVLGDIAEATTSGTSVLVNILVGTTDQGVQLATAILLAGKYLFSLFFPHPLCSDYGFNQIPLTGFTDWRVFLSLVVHVGLLYYAVATLRQRSILSFAILYYFFTFSIFSNIIMVIGSSYGDRFLYIPSLGFAIAVAYLLMQLFNLKWQSKKVPWDSLLRQNSALLTFIAAITLLYGFKTTSRNLDWKSSYDLYRADVQKSPNSAKLRFHYGLELMQKGVDEPQAAQKNAWLQQAQQAFEAAIRIYPLYADAYAQLGVTYYRQKDNDQAMTYYQKALEINDQIARVHSNVGTIYFETNQLAQAEAAFKKALEIDKHFVDAYRNLGSVYANQRKFDEALQQYLQAYKYAPQDAYINFFIGNVYKDLGNAAAGVPYLEKAYQLEPGLKQ